MNARAEFEDPEGLSMLRVPPHSAQSESAILGALLLDNSAWDRIGDILTDSDFYRHEHRLIFAALGVLINSNKAADVVTVSTFLQQLGQEDQVGGVDYLNSLAQYVPSAANIRRYAESVREKSILRKLISASDEIATSAFNTKGKPVAEIADDAERLIFEIMQSESDSSDEWQSMEQMIVQELDLIQLRADGGESKKQADNYIPTGLSELDELLDGGMRGGQLIIIGARPGMGKSAIADTIGLHVAKHLWLPVGKFSMEMQNQEGGQRALSATAKIPLHALRRPERMSPEHWSQLSDGVEKLRKVPFFSNEKGGLNINQVRTKARALKRKRGIRLLVVDYLQLMTGTDSRAPRTYQLEEASRGLKALAKELGIPVIALVQVNRGVEKEIDQMPRMSDIKDCGAIEQDADIIMFINRPIVLKPDLGDEWKLYAKVHLAKQRGGRTGYFDLQYIGENTRFANWHPSMERPTSQVRTRGGEL